ncbi:MAG: methyltransferase [Helicobacteraceae bacterium]|jgi:tRNA1(Val) A37 N6-methylase TrmN6|nr:methyltransferase [Helicobacteraceae bacterium]
MRLRQPENGYRYNTDSILLYRFASQKRLKGSLLDVGCGCGIVGLLLTRDFGTELSGVDIQEEMVAYAIENGALNNIKARFFAQDFRAFDRGEKYDAIVCNPPFYSAKTAHSRNLSLKIARNADALSIADFLRQAGRLLKSNGELFFCYDASELSAIFQTLERLRWRTRTIQFAHRTQRDAARLVFIGAKKSSVKAVKVLPPIFMRDDIGISDDMREIAKKAGTQCAT